MMLEAKDPAIRLFGRTIQLNDDVSAAYAAAVVVVDSEQTSSDHHFCSSNGSASPQSVFRKNSTDGEVSMDLKLEHGSSTSILENTNEDQAKSSTVTDDTTQAPTEEDKDSEEGSSGSQEQPLKKPTKILPCPRCNSTDTKFCYFNNYNVNQPRHFCKNCQRYWTAGGTMRSMVIGAGRRKNKTTSCLSHHPFAIPNTFQPHQDDNGVNSDAQKSASISFQNFATLWPNPAFVPSPFPVPVYAMPPYWGCQAMAWMPPTSASATMRPNSPLGKHPRDENELESSNKEHHGEDKRAETKVLAPKTLRFDDPSEAAKSSIWTTLGIKNEKTRTLDTSAFFGGFQLKGGETNATKWSTSRFLQANPAALCRSLKFQECGE